MVGSQIVETFVEEIGALFEQLFLLKAYINHVIAFLL